MPPPPVPVEPLLNPEANRYSAFPIQDPELWALYKHHIASFWTAEEINLTDDIPHVNALPENQLNFLSLVLSSLIASNKIVAENLCQNFINEITSLEAQFFYGCQLMMENIHNETYALLIDTYITNKKKRHTIFNAIEMIPAVNAKAKWCKMWCYPQHAS
jgi:ribonucleotide reductase beta subunit family protein with ferritin-like domain